MNKRFWLAPVLLGLCLVMALNVAVADEKEAKAFLGIVPAEVTSDIAADYGLMGPGTGVLVSGVTSDSPADKIGLRENDVIVKINSATVTGPEELRTQLAKYRPAETIELVYLRGGKEKSANVELAKAPGALDWAGKEWASAKDLALNIPNFDWKEIGGKGPFAGIVTQELSDGLASYFAVEKGALISEVVEDSPAEKAGLKAGDVITKIGDVDVEDEGDVRKAIRKHEVGDDVDFFIRRDKVPMTIKVKLGEHDFGSLIQGNVDVLTDADHGQLIIGLKGHELEELQDELRALEIELKDLPDVDVIELPDPPGSQRILIDMTSAEPVRNETGWRATIEQFKNRLQDAVLQMRLEIQYMKYKILEAKDRLLRATT
ncbi:MAG: PDZ domain-containing protein [bacterium]|nr:PDZ domain-containing protein [bacterium]